jgi:nitrite reductase (NADH) small subunit
MRSKGTIFPEHSLPSERDGSFDFIILCEPSPAACRYTYAMLPFEDSPQLKPVKIGTASELPACGNVKEFMAAGRMLCVASLNDGIYAMDNVCLHRGGPLGQGVMEDEKVVCPWHGWKFDPRNGEGPKASGRLAVYKVMVEGDEAFVEL